MNLLSVIAVSEIQDGGNWSWRHMIKGRFKKAFRVSRETFDLILKSIRPEFEKNTFLKTSLLLAFLVLVNLISTSRNR